MTRQRKLVLSIIKNSDDHLTAEETFKLAKRQMPSIVFATIYNNLNALTELGLIRRVKVSNGADCYDRTLSPHEHLICDCCGKLTDVLLGDLLESFENQTKVALTGYEINLHYICPDCKKNKV